jgi:hypothetical protein
MSGLLAERNRLCVEAAYADAEVGGMDGLDGLFLEGTRPIAGAVYLAFSSEGCQPFGVCCRARDG